MRLRFLFIATVLCAPSASAVYIDAACQSDYHDGRWIDAFDCLNGLLVGLPDTEPVERNIRDLTREVRQIQFRLPEKDRARLYYDGWIAWKNLDLTAARNAWVRYEAWTRLLWREDPTNRLDEVRRVLSLIRSIQRESFTPSPTPPKPKAKEKAKERTERNRPIRSDAFSTSMMKKAELAEQNGQLETALKLTMLALRAAPESKTINEHVKRLKRQME